MCEFLCSVFFFFFQVEDGIRVAQESRVLGDVYKRQVSGWPSTLRSPAKPAVWLERRAGFAVSRGRPRRAARAPVTGLNYGGAVRIEHLHKRVVPHQAGDVARAEVAQQHGLSLIHI